MNEFTKDQLESIRDDYAQLFSRSLNTNQEAYIISKKAQLIIDKLYPGNGTSKACGNSHEGYTCEEFLTK